MNKYFHYALYALGAWVLYKAFNGSLLGGQSAKGEEALGSTQAIGGKIFSLANVPTTTVNTIGFGSSKFPGVM